MALTGQDEYAKAEPYYRDALEMVRVLSPRIAIPKDTQTWHTACNT
jgi:hypothetical protein